MKVFFGLKNTCFEEYTMSNYIIPDMRIFTMATVTLTKWGNSIGIRIPSAIIKEAHLVPGEALNITSNKKGGFTLVPIKNQQEGWLDMFNAIADSENDKLLIELSNEFDEDEWKW
jgi:antitoxin component of MazEF toxin-antitoxin module